MTRPYIAPASRPAIYHGTPSRYAVFSDRDLQAWLGDHPLGCQGGLCEMRAYLVAEVRRRELRGR
ncbi:hypothetical protein [Nocardia sp. NPDC005978]|uniref:hypothetical protein n=1 Tax=unclassified Nocardia TaxID=2637762 RepID=UPI0033B6C2C7